MKQKKKRISIRLKILLPVVLLVTILCVVLGISSYRKMNDGMVAMGVEQADMVSKMAVEVIDGDVLKTLGPGCEDSAEYQTMRDAMCDIQQSYGIAFLYTLHTDGEMFFTVLIPMRRRSVPSSEKSLKCLTKNWQIALQEKNMCRIISTKQWTGI